MNRVIRASLAAAFALQPALAAAQPPPAAPLAPAPQPLQVYTPYARTVTHSPALMGGGIGLLSLGVVSMAGGIGSIVVDASMNGDSRGILTALLGIPTLIHGVGCVAAGIPMIVIGRRQIPVEMDRAGASSRFVPSVAPGPVTTVTWSF